MDTSVDNGYHQQAAIFVNKLLYFCRILWHTHFSRDLLLFLLVAYIYYQTMPRRCVVGGCSTLTTLLVDGPKTRRMTCWLVFLKSTRKRQVFSPAKRQSAVLTFGRSATSTWWSGRWALTAHYDCDLEVCPQLKIDRRHNPEAETFTQVLTERGKGKECEYLELEKLKVLSLILFSWCVCVCFFLGGGGAGILHCSWWDSLRFFLLDPLPKFEIWFETIIEGATIRILAPLIKFDWRELLHYWFSVVWPLSVNFFI